MPDLEIPVGLAIISTFRNVSAVCLVLWRHVDTISDLLFRRFSGFARAISNFSVIHRSHFLVPHL